MPYTYANLETIKLYTDFRKLVQLTNDDETVDYTDAANINENILMACENEAAQTIDNYFRNVYEVPLTGEDITPEVKRICANLTYIGLMYRRGDVAEEYIVREERLRDRLKKMAASDAEQQRKNRLEDSLPALLTSSGQVKKTGFQNSGMLDVLRDMGDLVE